MSENKYDKYIGMTFSPVTFEVTGDRIKNYAKSTDNTKPEFLEKDDKKLVAPLEFTSVYWISSFATLGGLQKEGIFKDISKLLHGGQRYEFLAPVKPGDKLELQVTIKDIYVKNEMLFLVLSIPVKNQIGEMVSRVTTTFIIRPGGF
ncbi:MAG: MaoC family dehydratase N-terminal domain-containing protein [Candidatus Freyarchaeum deiterrae]